MLDGVLSPWTWRCPTPMQGAVHDRERDDDEGENADPFDHGFVPARPHLRAQMTPFGGYNVAVNWPFCHCEGCSQDAAAAQRAL